MGQRLGCLWPLWALELRHGRATLAIPHAQITLPPLEPPSKAYLKQSCLERGWDRPEDPPQPHNERFAKAQRERETLDWPYNPVDPALSLSFCPGSDHTCA